MDRLALFKLLSFHVFLRSCAPNLAGTSRLRTETECVNLYVCVYVCVLHGIAEEYRESLIGKKVENKTCRLPDVSVKCVSMAQVHGEVSEACIRGILAHFPEGHLASCLGCAQLCTSTHQSRIQRVPSCSACCMFSHFVYC